MATKREITKAVNAYRKAAIELYDLTPEQAKRSIFSPREDPGEWAPESLAVVNFEYGDLPLCEYYARGGLDECIRWGEKAGVGFVEWINGGAAAIWD